jgi:hypothetical protein
MGRRRHRHPPHPSLTSRSWTCGCLFACLAMIRANHNSKIAGELMRHWILPCDRRATAGTGRAGSLA